MKEKIKKALAGRQKKHLPSGDLQRAGVIILVYEKDRQPYLLFTRRTDRVHSHKGQISFPGGSYEYTDESLLNTALRECYEEIGVRPEDLEVLGELDDTPTLVTAYLISPFVAAMPYPYSFRVDSEEVAEIIEVPLDHLLDEEHVINAAQEPRAQDIETYSYNWNGKVIWGTTARILTQFLSVLRQEGRL